MALYSERQSKKEGTALVLPLPERWMLMSNAQITAWRNEHKPDGADQPITIELPPGYAAGLAMAEKIEQRILATLEK